MLANLVKHANWSRPQVLHLTRPSLSHHDQSAWGQSVYDQKTQNGGVNICLEMILVIDTCLPGVISFLLSFTSSSTVGTALEPVLPLRFVLNILLLLVLLLLLVFLLFLFLLLLLLALLLFLLLLLLLQLTNCSSWIPHWIARRSRDSNFS